MECISWNNASVFALLEEVCRRTNRQAALARGKFKNDFGNMLYLTNNRVRATQLNQKLVAELCGESFGAVNHTVIPPTIVPYKAGFTYLAALAKFGYTDTLHICKYTDAWFHFFVCQIAREVIPDGFFKSSAEPNRRAHLSKDFSVFIRDVILNLKEAELQAFAQTQPDEVSEFFIKAYHVYRQQIEQFPNKENQFLHSLDAYRYLHANAAPGAHPFALNKVIVVENFGQLEPLFQAILRQVECPVFCVENRPLTDLESYRDNTRLYDFMTPLDEAEFIGWKVKSLLQNGVEPARIGIACANDESRAILELVFKRMNIAGNTRMKMIESPQYRLVKTASALMHRQEERICLQDIFFSENSKFNFQSARDFFRFQKAFSQSGIKSKVQPCTALNETILQFIQQPDLAETTISVLKKFTDFISTPRSVTQIAAGIINDKTDRKLVGEMMIALYELDENVPLSAANYVDEMQKMFKVLDSQELNVLRQTSWLEENARQDATAAEPVYHIDIATPEIIHTIQPDYLFLCGFSAAADKNPILSYPYPLVKALSLKTLPEKKKETASHIVYALNRARESYVSYAFLKMDKKEDGQSTFVKYLKSHLAPECQPINAHNGVLLKAEDVIELHHNQVPEPSWSLLLGGKWKEKKPAPLPDCTLGELLQSVLKRDEEDGTYHLPVKQFAHFILCPRRFVYECVAKYGQFGKDEEQTEHLQRGTFWHKVFELSAKKAGFLSQDAAKIKAALRTGLTEALAQKEVHLSGFTLLSEQEFVDKVCSSVLEPFAFNESSRRSVPGKKITTEKSYTLDIAGTPFRLSCKIDRLDEVGREVILWDYKTRRGKTEAIKFYQGVRGKSDKRELVANEDSLQLALYMYIYAAHHPDKTHLNAANIFLSGVDNQGAYNYYAKEEENTADEPAEKGSVRPAVLQGLLDDVLAAFKQLLGTRIYDIPNSLNSTRGEALCKKTQCNEYSYCNFKEVCDIIGDKK